MLWGYVDCLTKLISTANMQNLYKKYIIINNGAMKPRNLTPESRAKMGRPGKGYRQQLWDQYIKPEAPRLLNRIVQDALMGEPTLLKFLGERLVPKIIHNDVLDITGTPPEQIAKILSYYAGGDISSDEALKITAVVEKSVVLTTLKEMNDRMARIEQWQKDKSEGVTINGEANDGETKEDSES